MVLRYWIGHVRGGEIRVGDGDQPGHPCVKSKRPRSPGEDSPRCATQELGEEIIDQDREKDGTTPLGANAPAPASSRGHACAPHPTFRERGPSPSLGPGAVGVCPCRGNPLDGHGFPGQSGPPRTSGGCSAGAGGGSQLDLPRAGPAKVNAIANPDNSARLNHP